jgi:hypothetical protein
MDALRASTALSLPDCQIIIAVMIAAIKRWPRCTGEFGVALL